MTARIRVNPRLEHDIARSSRWRSALKDIAGDVAGVAADVYAPVDDGDYRDGIEADVVTVDGETRGRVAATDFKSGFIEFGTGTPGPTDAYAPLRRAAEDVIGPVSNARR